MDKSAQRDEEENQWRQYEEAKQAVAALCLSADEYQEAIKRLAERKKL